MKPVGGVRQPAAEGADRQVERGPDRRPRREAARADETDAHRAAVSSSEVERALDFIEHTFVGTPYLPIEFVEASVV